MSTLGNENSESVKHNWPLIGVGIAAGVLIASLAVAAIALYIANFNLLEWIE